MTALEEHKVFQAERRLRVGEEYKDKDLIFANSTGGLLDGANVARIYKKAIADAELRPIRFHDLRHTTASLLIEQGESPNYIQKQMRHASIEITFNRYGHLFPDVNN